MASSLVERVPRIAAIRRWIARHDQQLIKLLGSALVLVVAALLGRRPSVLPILGVAGGVAVLVFYRWPELGLMLTLIGGFTIPFSGPSGLNVAMLGMGLLIALWLVDMLAIQRKFELVDWPSVRAGLALCAVGVVSLLFGMLPWFPTQPAPLGAQLGGLALVLLAVGSYAWASNRIRTLRWLKLITFGYIVFASLHLVGYFVPGWGRLVSGLFPSGSTGSMFWAWLAILALSQALYNRGLPLPMRLLLGLVTMATMYVAFVVQNEWKSGWVPAALGIGVVLALLSWRVAALMAVLALVPAGAILQDLISSDVYSYSTRLEAWTILSSIIKANPVLGLGPANYYWYTPLFAIRGYYVSFNSHSQYVDLIAQFGLLGFLAFVWFLVEIGRIAWRMLAANFADDFARAYVIGAAGGLVAAIVSGFFGDWLIPFFYNVGMYGFRASVLPWIFLGGLTAMAKMNLPSGQTTPEPAL